MAGFSSISSSLTAPKTGRRISTENRLSEEQSFASQRTPPETMFPEGLGNEHERKLNTKKRVSGRTKAATGF
jgi:hypothetical protein